MSLNESIFEDVALKSFEELGFPPELQDAAVQTVLAQAKLLCAEWA